MRKHAAAIAVAALFAMSAVIYLIQYVLFHDLKDTGFYMLQDWAFLPVQIAIVTIVVGMIVNGREKSERLSRTRTLASAFFRDFGTDLIVLMIGHAERSECLESLAAIDQNWAEKDFVQASAALKKADIKTNCTAEGFIEMREPLMARKADLQAIASNPALLEHEDFTDMLWAIFHMMDELTLRGELSDLSAGDIAHLNSDLERALRGLLVNWVCHIAHIKSEYPYLYVIEAKKNPVAGHLASE